LEFKRTLFANIDSHTREDVIIASSSSGIPSSQFVTECKKNPSRVLIGHPFNPPHLVPLVEVVPHPGTEAKYTTQAIDFYRSLNKSPVLVRQECPGFIANRLQAAICNEAYSLVNQGIVSAEELGQLDSISVLLVFQISLLTWFFDLKDITVTAGLGLRWALTGPFMTNVLGGGGGKTGFKNLIEHLGPGSQVWKKDMDAHPFLWDSESIGKLDASVQELLNTVDPKVVEEQRDEVLVKVVLLKGQTSALV
jgi:3-hydroxyacyl-CoA dehydrogenase